MPKNRGGLPDEFRDSRRGFLAGAALAAGSAVASTRAAVALAGEEKAPPASPPGGLPDADIRTVCLQCNTGCGIRVHTRNGSAVKIDGNPYSPWTMVPSLPYATPLAQSSLVEGSLCPKGQSGIQTAHDPYRVTSVLKRSGPRGSNRWETVPFDKALEEIVEGGRLFAKVPGEEGREVAGLRSLFALRDPKVAKEISDAVSALRKKKAPDDRKKALAEFREKFADHLQALIDPDHPDFGPRNNQFVFAWGRLKGGRSEFIKRFVSDSFGSVNAHGHTTVCQGSLYFTGKAMSDQFSEGKFTGGGKAYWQADTANVEFLIAIGSAYIEGGYGPTHHARKLMANLVEGKVKIAVVDPRFSKIAAKAWKWVPAKPGTEGALALGMIRWILDNGRHDAKFLSAANKAAAKAAGESTWTNAAWLVKEDGSLLRASEIDIDDKRKKKAATGPDWELDPFVVLQGGTPRAVDPDDDSMAITGDLLFTGEVSGIRVKTSLQILRESANSRTLAEWAALCGLEPSVLEELAREFTSHGKRAVADLHRGASQHTNGFYNVLAIYSLNALVGNFDWKGGLLKATTFDHAGGKPGQPYPLAKLHPAKAVPFGLSVIRHEASYEESTVFSGYPAKRNWYPFASDIYQEIIPSIGDAYPYPAKALFLYMANPAYALPAGNTNIEVLADPSRLPLVVACDITIGETTLYADYVFPDTGYLERWEFQGSHPSIAEKVQPIRNPAIASPNGTVRVFGEEMPLSLEAMLIGLAAKLGLPGYGPDGLGKELPLARAEDVYLKMAANVASGDGPGEALPEADDAEVAAFLEARKHLPATVFDAERWKKAAGEAHWKRVVYVLNRGGRFQDSEKAFSGEKFANKYGKTLNLYLEKVARAKSAMSGKPLAGVAAYFPVADLLGKPVPGSGDPDALTLITYRVITQTKSRTVANDWLTQVQPSNEILVNSADAKRLGIAKGQRVRVVSASNPRGVWDLRNGTEKPMVGAVSVTEGLRPGVVAFSLGKGHWAYGSSDAWIDGKRIPGDPRRAAGVHANAAMAVDPHLKNTCLVDPIGGSVSFYDSPVRLVKEG